MKRHTRCTVAALLLVGLAGCGAPSASSYNQQGNDLFTQGIYAKALEQYKEASLLAPDHPAPSVNLGNTRYELGDYLGAIEAPKSVLEAAPPETQALIYYNQGNAHFRLREYEDAIGKYQETLRRTPDDADAKYNLELAQKILDEQQQQQQQAGGQQPQDPNQPQDQPGQDQPQDQPGQQPEDQPQDGQGQQPRPQAPPSNISPGEAERKLDQLRRSEDRDREDRFDNYAVGDQGDPQDQSGDGNGW